MGFYASRLACLLLFSFAFFAPSADARVASDVDSSVSPRLRLFPRTSNRQARRPHFSSGHPDNFREPSLGVTLSSSSRWSVVQPVRSSGWYVVRPARSSRNRRRRRRIRRLLRSRRLRSKKFRIRQRRKLLRRRIKLRGRQRRRRHLRRNPFQGNVRGCDAKAFRYRTHEGDCNNLKFVTWGSAGTSKLPFSKPLPADLQAISARSITNAVCREPFVRLNRRKLSELTTFFGQFIDHDFAGSDKGDTKWNIPIPELDPVFAGRTSIPFTRNKRTAAFATGFLAPVNKISHYLDGSTVYGSSEKENMGVREGFGGLLKLRNDLLSTRERGLFLSGDARVNENPHLIAFHTLFAKEHNRVAVEVSTACPRLNDESIFQLTRLIVGAEIQAITYYEFIPAVLGRLLPVYRGYNPRLIGAVTNEFSTVAFRVGHTMINKFVTSVDRAGSRTQTPLGQTFFRPDLFRRIGMDDFIRGMLSERAGEIDNGITKEVLDFLIDSDRDPTRLDLAAFNVQRGRDHGILPYTRLRSLLGLPRVRTFSDITSNTAAAQRLENVYGSVDRIDAWIGGICEDHTSGSLGPLFARIWTDQFVRLRDGDRFYFERPGVFSKDEIRRIPTLRRLLGSRRSLGRIMKLVIQHNTDVESKYLRGNPFFA